MVHPPLFSISSQCLSRDSCSAAQFVLGSPGSQRPASPRVLNTFFAPRPHAPPTALQGRLLLKGMNIGVLRCSPPSSASPELGAPPHPDFLFSNGSSERFALLPRVTQQRRRLSVNSEAASLACSLSGKAWPALPSLHPASSFGSRLTLGPVFVLLSKTAIYLFFGFPASSLLCQAQEMKRGAAYVQVHGLGDKTFSRVS